MTNCSLVGLSDHTTSNLACLGAVALGAVILERHFTDSKSRIGPDIENSMDAKELYELRVQSEQMFLMSGGSKVEQIKEEQNTRDFAFATYVATADIHAGDVICEGLAVPRRPACGDFSAAFPEMLIGKRALTTINAGEHIMKSQIEE